MKHGLRIVTQSPRETMQAARWLGEELLLLDRSKPIVIALTGELGAGKTTFIKGLAKGLGIKKLVTSPTFILINAYTASQGKKILYHVDPYRLRDVKDIEDELTELLSVNNAIIAIEWAKRLEYILPGDTIWVSLTHRGTTHRSITIQ